MKMNDIMVDLETMDNIGSSAIVAIGAIQCDLTTGETGDEYYRVIKLHGQQELGMTINPDTIYWWMDQSDDARQALMIRGRISIESMCQSFTNWLCSLSNGDKPISPENLRMWGNGASFDNAIVRHAFAKCKHEFPIPFWNDRDMRTIVGFYPKQLQEQWRKGNYRAGVAHNALDDARHQVKYCSDILSELGVKELY